MTNKLAAKFYQKVAPLIAELAQHKVRFYLFDISENTVNVCLHACCENKDRITEELKKQVEQYISEYANKEVIWEIE